MRRRQLLTTVAIAATALVAGCLGDDDSDGPTSAAVAFYEAFDAGDVDTLNALFHPDADEEPLTEADGDDLEENVHIDIESAELLEEDGEAASVEITYTLDADDVEGPIEVTETVQLRASDGNWLILDIE